MAAVHLEQAEKNIPGILRKGDGKALKEKIIAYYESILKGEDPSRTQTRFWDDFFLMKVNVDYLVHEIGILSSAELTQMKNNLNRLFSQCVRVLQMDDNMIRYVNSLQTLCCLIRSVFRKGLRDSSVDILDILIGFDAAECKMQNLIECINRILSEDFPVSVKNLTLKLVLIMITAKDNISQNVMMEYLMVNSVFESLMKIFSSPDDRANHGIDSILILAVLVNYRKYEAANPYVIKLSVLDDELALNGIGWIIGEAFMEYNRQYAATGDKPQSWFGSLLGSVLSSADSPSVEALRINEAILLALYEAVHLNRNFITILTHTKSPSSPKSPTGIPIAVQSSIPAIHTLPSSPSALAAAHPANLLGMFLTFTSIVLQHTKVERTAIHARLCLVILTCISEDQFANTFLHDTNIAFSVTLYRAPLLHRKVKGDKSRPSSSLACSLLDLMVEFTLSHLSKNLMLDMHCKCLGIIHRVLCHQKRCRVRLDYDWKDLWTALINLLRFVVSQEGQLLPKQNVFILIHQVSNIFNLFITYGDTFLPDATTYDELYYEIIRMHEAFENSQAMALRYAAGQHAELKESASTVVNGLKNISSIIIHYTAKINAWMASKPGTQMSTEQVLEVVRENYDTLTLKLQDNLDYFEKYSERPKEVNYFSNLLRMIVTECRDSISLSTLQQKVVLSELSNVPAKTP